MMNFRLATDWCVSKTRWNSLSFLTRYDFRIVCAPVCIKKGAGRTTAFEASLSGRPAPYFRLKKATNLIVATGYADNTLRPFWRRRANTLRPLLVLIRARKPWTRARWRFFGWNVRFIGLHLLVANLNFFFKVQKDKLFKHTVEV